jgi:hypothetical protein
VTLSSLEGSKENKQVQLSTTLAAGYQVQYDLHLVCSMREVIV